MMNRLRIAVLMGGSSAEAEISRKSGQMVCQALQGTGAIVLPVDVRGPQFALPPNVDVAFIALHGTFGEDGQVQRILEKRGVLYTGSGSEASARAFDKRAAKECFATAGIPTPEGVVVNGELSAAAEMKLPVVVKPARQGSSVGVTIVRQPDALAPAIEAARRYDEYVIVEQFIRGRELTVGLLGDKALPVIEISTEREFFDFEAKYKPGGAQEVCPAPLPPTVTLRVQLLARLAHEQLGCRDFSRVDLMLDERDGLFVLEVNTIPGLTATSLFPKAAAARGLSMRDVCVRMVEMALTRRMEAALA
jgi:D-alanine-D-alanine ligase